MPETLPAAFTAALSEAAPPAAWPAPLAALWWLARDPSGPNSTGWAQAHGLVQDAPGCAAAWVHAHLHRIEGDSGNARYWYGRAGREEPRGTVGAEYATIVSALLDRL
ncbi:hypothetical protein SAMN05216360_11312 [Methylobacterium phyllostachyos]|uniref:Uncharacterized protein n=1 Tax=Methylobacterium phyllostachyos TaxID=582672 RepID=A0A1H0FMT6_9HYPH|nr:hypothetical protein [Methylobacterium phyllostachyos]SDN95769.1 hypothetical protein SAMN05216360_11312 [Methylobacterium phyllostachyos]